MLETWRAKIHYNLLLASERSYMEKGSEPILSFEKSFQVSNDFCHFGMIDDCLVIAFRGSDDSQDWSENLSLDFDNDLVGRLLSHIKINNFDFRKIYLTGHSRGGVLAQEFALKLCDLKLCFVQEVVTFGSPKVENPEDHKKTYKHYRYVNGSDAVPDMPPGFFNLFRSKKLGHHGKKIHLMKRNFFVSLFKIWGTAKYHFLSDYKKSFVSFYDS